MSRSRCLIVLWGVLIAVSAVPRAATTQRDALEAVHFRQQIGGVLPAGVRFMAAEGELIALHSLAKGRPLVLVMSWFDCPNLCPMLLDQLAEAAAGLPFSADDYRVAVVSIDPGDTPDRARDVHASLRARHGDVVNDWRLLTGQRAAIRQLARAVGFEYAYDAERDRYAHPAGFVVVNPGGRIGRYLLGIRPDSADLKLALVDAGKGSLGNPVDQLVLRCYRFDPQTGRYNLAVMGTLQWAGGGFILAMGGLVLWLWRRERS